MPRGQRLTALRTKFLAFCEAEQLDAGQAAGEIFDQVFTFQEMMFLGEQEPDELDSMTLFELISQIIPARTMREDLSDIPVIGRELGRFMASRYPKRWEDLDEFLTDIDAYIAAGTVDTVPKSGQTRMLQYAIDAGFDLSDEADIDAFMTHFNSLTRQERSAILGDDEPTAPPLVTGTFDGQAAGIGQRRADFLADGAPEDFLPPAPAHLDEETRRRIDSELMSVQETLREVLGLPDEMLESSELKDGADDPCAILTLPLAAAVLRLLAWVDAGEKNRRKVTGTLAIKPADLTAVAQLCALDDAKHLQYANRMDDVLELGHVWRVLQTADFIVNDTQTTVCCSQEVRSSGLVDLAHRVDAQLQSGASLAETAAAVRESADEAALLRLHAFVTLWTVSVLFLSQDETFGEILDPIRDHLTADLVVLFATGSALALPDRRELSLSDERLRRAGTHLETVEALVLGPAADEDDFGGELESANSLWTVQAFRAVAPIFFATERLQGAGLLTSRGDGTLQAEGFTRLLLLHVLTAAEEMGIIEGPGTAQ